MLHEHRRDCHPYCHKSYPSRPEEKCSLPAFNFSPPAHAPASLDNNKIITVMASVRRKPNSRYWIACYKDAEGRPRQRSTKETSRDKALTIAKKFERAYAIKLTEAQARKILGEIYEEVRGEQLIHSTVVDFVRRWLDSKKPPMMTQSAWHRYKNAADKFLSFLGDNAKSDIAYISRTKIHEFVVSVSNKHSPSTANTDLKILSGAFRAAVGEGLRLDNPCNGVARLPRSSRGIRRPFTVDEVKVLLGVADDEWLGIILFGLYTGQRLGDIVGLTWSQLEERARLKLVTSKTGRAVVVPLVAPVQRYLSTRQVGRPGDFLFPRAAAAKAQAEGNTRRLSATFFALLVKSGLAAPRSKKSTGRGHSTSRKTSELSFHSLRHTTTSWLKRANVADGLAMDIVGHDTLEASGQYTHFDEPSKRAALEALPQVY